MNQNQNQNFAIVMDKEEITRAANETVEFLRNGGRKTTDAQRSDAHKKMLSDARAKLAFLY
jgi:hypothetical protein